MHDNKTNHSSAAAISDSDTRQAKNDKYTIPLYTYERGLHEVTHTDPDQIDLIEGLSIDYESIFYVDLDQDMIQTYRSSPRLDYLFGQNNNTCSFSGFRDDYSMAWLYPEDRGIFREVLSPEYIRLKLAEQKMFYANFRIVHNGSLEHLQLRIVHIGKSEHISQIVIGTRSVDDEIRYEQKQKAVLAEALIQAKSAVAAKNVFLANVSHDIRTPLNAIIGFTSLAKKHIDNPVQLISDLDKIADSGEQLLHLLNNVLEIAWSESGKIQPKQELCDLANIMQSVRETLLCRANAKNLTFNLDVTDLKYTKVLSDSEKIHQMLMHLCSNAVKYTQEEGQISVTGKLHKITPSGYGTYLFTIEDTGIGISKQFLPHIFEPFERQQNTTLSGVHGMGLGLTIVKNIVDMLNGNIEVQSETGVGTCFTITLTLQIEEGQLLPELLANQDKPSANSQKILIVEDNEINLEIESELLKDLGFALDTAANGSIAVDMIRHSQPGEYGLILMDIQMPVMNGYEAARAIRSTADPALANIPIIALSANTFQDDIQKSKEAGMNAHLSKPIDIPKLLEQIDQLMESPCSTV